ncbi:MAG: MoaD/ThiS family protein [Acidobacteriota bacterium]|nr:MoaD/ThiS family protein [Acidobacteriota bacterium]
MTVDIEVFGQLVDLMGGTRHSVELSERHCTVGEATAQLAREIPALEPALSSIAYAIGDRVVRRDEPLHDGQTLVLLAPVSGG